MRRPLGWRFYAMAALWTVNAILLAITVAAFLYADVAADWTQVYSQLGARIGDGTLYEWPDTIFVYRYSPVLAYFLAAITPIGTLGWLALHFVPLPLLGARLGLVTAASFPFWSDVYNGNVLVFLFVAAALALRGDRWAQLAFLALALLIPRPLMLPVVAWLLWQHAHLRAPFVAMFLAHTAGAWLTGYGTEWIGVLLARGTDDVGAQMDFGPSLVLGAWWWPIGLALAGWFTVKGRLGFASICASPYLLPPYLLMGLLESVHVRRSSTGQVKEDDRPSCDEEPVANKEQRHRQQFELKQ